MNFRARLVIAGTLIVWAAIGQTRSGATAKSDMADNPTVAESQPAKTAAASRAEAERQFSEALTGATLKGTWQMTGKGGLTGDGGLTAPQEDSYTITSATKLAGDFWVISARIRYGEVDVTLPVPVRVVWADDTPIITLDNLNLPGVGRYSARVVIFGGFYCGIWFCGEKNYGGVMSGRVIKKKPAEQAEVQPASPSLSR